MVIIDINPAMNHEDIHVLGDTESNVDALHRFPHTEIESKKMKYPFLVPSLI